MPGTPEQIRAAMEGLSPEQQAQFVSELERRRAAMPKQKTDPADIFRGQLGRMGSFGAAPTQEDITAGREANIPALTLGAMAAPAMVPTSLAALKTAALGVAGASAGGYAGKGIGQGLEYAGAPEGTAEAGGTIGGLVGGIGGPLGGTKVLTALLSRSGGNAGLLGKLLGAAGESAAKKVAPEVAEAAAKRAAMEAEKVAVRKRALDIAERRLALAEQKMAQAAQKAPKPTPKAAPTSPEPTAGPEPEFIDPSAVKVLPFKSSPKPQFLPGEAVSVAPTDTATIVLKLQQQMGTADGRRIVKELISQMPPEQASVIKALLAKGQEHPATVLGKLFDPTKSEVGRVAKPGAELARLLGQIQ